jgi:hypothetical protein
MGALPLSLFLKHQVLFGLVSKAEVVLPLHGTIFLLGMFASGSTISNTE